MAVREIIKKGDPTLNKHSHAVTKFDKRLHSLLDDLHDTLNHAGGLGLAGPQIGILRRVALVIDEDETVYELVNPEIIEKQGEQEGLEGCLSIPGFYGIVTRPMNVKVRAQDRHGNEFFVEGEGITARCFCHELEHLDGHLYDEHTDRLYTEKELEKLMENEKQKR